MSDQSLVPLTVLADPAPSASTSSQARASGFPEHPWRLAALVAQAPLLALLMVLTLGSSPAPLLFSFGLAAIWFGLSSALLGRVVDASVQGRGLTAAGVPLLLTRLLLLAGMCMIQTLLMWIIAVVAGGLHGQALPALGLLALAAAVGLALGLVISALDPGGKLTWATLPVAVLLLWLLGGEVVPLFRLPPVVPSFMPSRWTFEGLVLLEAERRGDDIQVEHPRPALDRVKDPADLYFPVESERMGLRADVLALGAMLMGLAGMAGFITWASRPAL
jgi:hypothetical protein